MKPEQLVFPLLFAAFLGIAFTPEHVRAQDDGHEVSGVVTTANDGMALPGVNVVLKGMAVGTTTNLDGEYHLEAPSPTDTLVFSFVGYTSQEIPINGRSTVDVQLAESELGLEEVVVVGYGTQRRADLTGSVSSVSSEDITSLPTPSLEQTIQGRVAGVQAIQGSGAPGAGFTVRIRGGNSMRGGNEPLWVIDGFPTNNPGNINTEDIQSIEVLKDASATAIYGSRGANGVVIVTTKRGSRDEHHVEFDSYVSTRQVSNEIDLMNAREFAEIANERARNDGEEPIFDENNLSNNTDWQDEIFRDALAKNFNLRAYGGSDRVQYSVSGSYFDEEGVIPNSDFERGSIRLNLDSDISDRFRVANRLTLSRSVQNSVVTGTDEDVMMGILGSPPVEPVYSEDGTYSEVSNYFFSPAVLHHPLLFALERMSKTTSIRVLGNVSAEYDLLSGLTAKVMIGTNYVDDKSDTYSNRIHPMGSPAGSGSASRWESTTWLNENTLTYDHTFNSNHRINATAGYTWQTTTNTSLSASASDFVTDDLLNNNLGAGDVFNAPNTGQSDWALQSWLGRVNYTLMERYLFTVTARADGSSRFGSGNKWGFFPSGAFAWRLSEEPFLRNSESISNLKLRLSWGRTGNQEIGNYQSLQRIVSQSAVFGDEPVVGFAPDNLANPSLQWETTEQFDAGLDLGLWNERLRVTTDLYVKNTSDLLALVQLPPSSGFGSSLQNIGGIRNTGLELTLGGDLLRGEDVFWSVDGNVAINRNEVTKLADGDDVMVSPVHHLVGSIHMIREGEPLSAFYGHVEDGYDEDGQIQYVDQNGDGDINDEDRVILGHPHPNFTYGLSTSFSYKNVDVDLLIQGVQGMELYNYNRYQYANSFSRGHNQMREVLDYWTPENPDAEYPKPSANTSFRFSDRFIESGSYLRLKNVRVGYTVPLQRFGVSSVQDASIYVSSENLFTLTNYSWFDPEVTNYGSGDLRLGVDQQTYPKTRSFTLGVQLHF